MRYKIIDVYPQQSSDYYIAKCLKAQSPQFILIQSPSTLCKGLDILDVDHLSAFASSATGEKNALKILKSFDHLDKIYEIHDI